MIYDCLFANIFMSELENCIIPKLKGRINNWTRYVDDTFAFIKPGCEKKIQEVLNKFDDNIKFTYEAEEGNKISFLDVLITRNQDKLETSVYRKPSCTGVYINWNSHAPNTWKIATMKSLIQRAFMISSTINALETEIAFIQKFSLKTMIILRN